MVGNPVRRLKARRWNRSFGWEHAGTLGRDTAHESWPVDFWRHRWVKVGDTSVLRDPRTGSRIAVPSYFVVVDGTRHPFAALTFDSGLTAFFLPV